MTRILVQRGSSSSSSSSSNSNRTGSLPNSSLPSSSTTPLQNQLPCSSSSTTPLPSQLASSLKDDQIEEEVQQKPCLDDSADNLALTTEQIVKNEDISLISYPQESSDVGSAESEKIRNEDVNTREVMKESYGLQIKEEDAGVSNDSVQTTSSTSYPPPPPLPPPKLSSVNMNARLGMTGNLNSQRSGSSRRATAWPVVSARSSPNGSRPSSPRSHCENEGYNSADEQGPCFVSSYDDTERERQFEMDIRRVKGFELRRMLEDGNCLFRAVADQVYGDSELHDSVRQMCIDYMEQERDHFSQFMTEGFTSYIQRKRRNKVYGNNIEIQALAEMYNRPIHIYCYSTEPINIFHGSYNTDVPPIRLSYHSGNHYNSLVDPRRTAIGAGLGFSSLQGAWFRELPSGVLDSLSPEQVMECQSEEDCAALVRLLPSTEAALLGWAINLMADVVEMEHLNKMNAHNIAMVFAPNMTQMVDPLTALMYAVQVMNFLKSLITKTLRERTNSTTVGVPVLCTDPSDESGNRSPSQPSVIINGLESASESNELGNTTDGEGGQSYSTTSMEESYEECGESPKKGQSSIVKDIVNVDVVEVQDKGKGISNLSLISSLTERIEAWR